MQALPGSDESRFGTVREPRLDEDGPCPVGASFEPLEGVDDDLERIRSSLRDTGVCLLHDLEAGLHLRLLAVEAGGEFSGTPMR